MNSNLAAIKTSQTAMHYGLTELKIFLAVADEGNLSRGANLTKNIYQEKLVEVLCDQPI